jgi:hypothetical protein
MSSEQYVGLTVRIWRLMPFMKMPLLTHHAVSAVAQNQIVAQIEAEQKIINENNKLIEIFQNKISDTISALWA